MEMRLYRSIECRLRKLNYLFSLFISNGKMSMLDFTHHCISFACSCSIRCVLFLFIILTILFICLIWSIWLFACTKPNRSEKRWEKKISMTNYYLWLQSETNYATTSQLHMHCTHTHIHKMHHTAMTLQLQPVNSAILTVLVLFASVRYMSFEFSTLAAFAHSLGRNYFR